MDFKNIIKRDGTKERYNVSKIKRVIRAAFASIKEECPKEALTRLIENVEERLRELAKEDEIKVEQIQDVVEIELMRNGFYREARRFILYREERAKYRAIILEIEETVTHEGMHRLLKDIQKDFPHLNQSFDTLGMKYRSFHKAAMTPDECLKALIRAAVECITAEEPDWEFIAGRLLSFQSKLNVGRKMEALKIGTFFDKLTYLTREGYYGRYILEHYSKEEIDEIETFFVPERDHLLTYSGLDLLLRRYTIRNFTHEQLETPQEMFMGIAMHLAMNERHNRLRIVRDIYDILSKLQVTMATPTMANARKPHYQMSSCFIDTVPDSLDGIYRSITNFANVSKFGGGMGLYFGKVRANGSDIRGYKGAAGGVVRWIKLANDTAVAVDQLGVRSGAVACYLDVWHKDILDFLQLRTNNGDDRMKAHDVFPAVCYPDLFWKMVREDMNQPWYLMCPHEIKSIKGYELEDYYGEEWERRYHDCVNDSRIPKTEVQLKDMIRLILKSAIETGTPFAFFRDTVNRANPNKHKGMIYSSNLCVEIAQNMSAIESVSTEVVTTPDGDTVIVEKSRPGDFVVCNLSSLVVSKINFDDEQEVRHVLRTIVRALDNVIDLNFYPIEYARITNRRYRPIGLGVMGYHHFLAKKGVAWESEEHLQLADKLMETINYYAIQASAELAAEKGGYEYFEGSDWQTGDYFRLRQYEGTPRWDALAEEVRTKGLRNGYLLAVAPTSSTSIIAGTTACTDPIMNRFFLEEKKGSTIARVAPDLNDRTWWLYKNAHLIDQTWSIRAAGVRQRHVDQSQSTNLYITNDFTLRQVLELYIKAWECGLKTIYYVRSKSLEIEECESCSS